MAQAMLDRRSKSTSVSTQTCVNDDEFCIYMSKNKTFRVYHSKSYKSSVLSFNFGNFKKYLITKPMWKVFRRHIPHVDRILLDYKNEQNTAI